MSAADGAIAVPAAELVFRLAWDDEKPRLARIFPEAARAGESFVAVRERPVERIVGAVFWRELANSEAGHIAEFTSGVLPVLAGTGTEAEFLRAFQAFLADKGRVSLLRTANPLPEGPESRLLQDCGFAPAYRQDCYQGAWANWLNRTASLLARPGSQARAVGLTLAKPTSAHAEALAGLAAPFAALALAGGQFDPNYSALLFQGERLVGACLVKRHERQISIALLAVAKGVAAGLATALLFDHCQRALADEMAGEAVSEIHFRADPAMSPAVKHLARRFDCQLLASLTAWQLALATAGAGGAGGADSSLHPLP